MLNKTADSGPIIYLTLENVETQVQLRSISSSGLAVLSVDDARGALEQQLTQKLDRGESVRLTAPADAASVLVEASLVWIENPGAGEATGGAIDVFVDCSGSPRWGELLAWSRLPR